MSEPTDGPVVVDREGCCEDWRKPCSYHLGMLDGIEACERRHERGTVTTDRSALDALVAAARTAMEPQLVEDVDVADVMPGDPYIIRRAPGGEGYAVYERPGIAAAVAGVLRALPEVAVDVMAEALMHDLEVSRVVALDVARIGLADLANLVPEEGA